MSELMSRRCCWSSSRLTGRRCRAVSWNSRRRRGWIYKLDYENKISSQQTENLKQFAQHYYSVNHQPFNMWEAVNCVAFVCGSCNGDAHISEVTLHRVGLVLRWVTAGGYTLLVLTEPFRLHHHGYSSGVLCTIIIASLFIQYLYYKKLIRRWGSERELSYR